MSINTIQQHTEKKQPHSPGIKTVEYLKTPYAFARSDSEPLDVKISRMDTVSLVLKNRQSLAKIVLQVQKEKQKFVDTEFPPSYSSIFIDPSEAQGITFFFNCIYCEIAQVFWKRTTELSKDPFLFKEGVAAGDVRPETMLDDQWFIGALTSEAYYENAYIARSFSIS